MKVAVTGGTGFVGAHTVAALVGAGHEVRLLVRSPDRIAPALAPLGVHGLEHRLCDVTDAVSVEQALRGCHAVLHAASVYSFDARRADEIRRTNVTGTDIVLDAAWRAGMDPILHVSSIVALMGRPRTRLGPDSEPGEPPFVYARSKADSDRAARRLQTQGAPVTITYPGQVLGPHDPYWGEGAMIVEGGLEGRYRWMPSGAFGMSDVRDVAQLHAALLSPGQGARRFLAPVRVLTGAQFLDALGAVTGRRLKTSAIPYWTMKLPLRLMDALQHVVPIRLPFSAEPIWVLTSAHALDDSRTRAELGLPPRPIEDTLTDQIRWMVSAGRLNASLAGAAMRRPQPSA